MSVTNLQVHRLRRLTVEPDAVWQGGWLPVGRVEQRGGAQAFVMPVFAVVGTDVAGPRTDPRPADEVTTSDLLTALVTMACDPELAGYRPRRVEVCDPEEADFLGEALAPAGIEVQLVQGPVERLPAVQEFTHNLVRAIADDVDLDDALPDLLDAPEFEDLEDLEPLNDFEEDGDADVALTGVRGMTEARLTAFAQAALQFHRSAPWRRLDGFDDLIAVAAPEPPPGFAHLSVLGSAGAMQGLGFYPSHQAFRDLVRCADGEPGEFPTTVGRRASVIFEPVEEMPVHDAIYWDEHALPVAADDAYPVVVIVEPDGTATAPTAAELTFLEGLLRALAATSDDELDQARWQRTVPTADGRVAYAFVLPEVLDPPDQAEQLARGYRPDPRAADLDGLPDPPRDRWDRAQRLCQQAFAAFGRRRTALARQALRLQPGCADAHVILAEELDDPRQRLPHYEEAVAAGLPRIDRDQLAAVDGELWRLYRARPYLRALLGLGFTLHELGRLDEAVDRYRELLAHDRDDHLLTRGRLLRALLDARRDREVLTEAAAVDEPDGLTLWAKALATFRVQRASDAANAALTRARRHNRFVRGWLLDPRLSDQDVSDERPSGQRGVALALAMLVGGAWRQTEGAAEWLRGHRLGRG